MLLSQKEMVLIGLGHFLLNLLSKCRKVRDSLTKANGKEKARIVRVC